MTKFKFPFFILTVSPLALTKDNFPKVVTVLDSSIASSTAPLAIRANSSSSTIFLSGKDIASYVKSLETSETKVVELDFAALRAETVSAAPAQAVQPASAAAPQESAKIDGAVQIAIGVKKEVDFASWYTNVGFFFRPSSLFVI
jgi:prolyl-tRNA synthetase